MPDEVSTREFEHAIDRLQEMMTDGFSGVHSRLDVLNGRTRKIEISSAVQWVLWVLLGAALQLGFPLFFK